MPNILQRLSSRIRGIRQRSLAARTVDDNIFYGTNNASSLYKDRYDYRRTLISFAREMSSETDLDAMLSKEPAPESLSEDAEDEGDGEVVHLLHPDFRGGHLARNCLVKIYDVAPEPGEVPGVLGIGLVLEGEDHVIRGDRVAIAPLERRVHVEGPGLAIRRYLPAQRAVGQDFKVLVEAHQRRAQDRACDAPAFTNSTVIELPAAPATLATKVIAALASTGEVANALKAVPRFIGLPQSAFM